jgi:hypothetical protein
MGYRLVSPQFVALLLWSVLGCSAICRAQKPQVQPASRPVSGPQEEKREEAIIVLERKVDYFGVAPAYVLIIYPDGSVTFIGQMNVKTKGAARGSIRQGDLRRLVEEFDRINYFSLHDKYETREDGCPFVFADAGTAYVWYRLGDRRKSVQHYLGCSEEPSRVRAFETFPRELYRLGYLIDAVANSEQWIK